MSDKSKRPRSGEFANLTSQRAKDGTLEYVIGDESSSPIEEAAAPPSTPSSAASSTSSGSKAPLLLGAGIFLAVIIATIAFFASGEEGERVAQDDEVEQVGFKAYSGNMAPAEEPKRIEKKNKVVEVDEEIPEELAGWDLDETDEEVIVIEEYDGEPEPAAVKVVQKTEPAVGEPYTKEHEKFSIGANGSARYASPEQRKLLRQFNEQLDRGERPVIPKANLPSALRPISPKMQNLDNITGPKFVPGKLHRIDKKENAASME